MNQHYEFWVKYYERLIESDTAFAEALNINNENLTKRIWKTGNREILPGCNEEPFSGCKHLRLEVNYPGLLVGIGNAHDSGKKFEDKDKTDRTKKKDKKKDTPEEIKLGILLDSVTGLPFLPGSMLKGILRSAFLYNVDYIKDLLQYIDSSLLLTAEQVEELELDIFGHQHPCHNYETDIEAGTGRDVFFDVYPIQPDGKSHLIGIENITSHRAKNRKLDGLTKLNPLTLLKIMPGVVLLFRFYLNDTDLKDGIRITANHKLNLFKQILLDLGAGAKTNVGFGVLIDTKNPEETDKYYYLEEMHRD